CYTGFMTKKEEVQEIEEVQGAEEVAEPTPEAIQERIVQLKAIAYDHISTIEKLQGDLRQVSDAIRQLNEKLTTDNGVE
ncbi:unnamed protein product, partial [marine sediment metagenome]